MQVSLDTLIQVATFLPTVIGCAWYLGSKIARIEAQLQGVERRVAHMEARR